jgi:uncharacterized protein YkwD
MVTHHYFAHDSRSGARFSAHIARTGGMRGRRHWRVGENLAWGTGPYAAPRLIVLAWLRSPAHRRVLLKRAFRVVGIGIVSGTPFAGHERRADLHGRLRLVNVSSGGGGCGGNAGRHGSG